MNISFNAVTILLGAIIAQALFAAGLLWIFPVNRFANRILSLLMVAIATWLLDSFFRVSGIYFQDPTFYFLPIYYSLAFGPLIYFYTRSLTNQAFAFTGKNLVHFVPVALQADLYWFLRTQPYEFRTWYWHTIHRPFLYRLEFDGTWVSLIIYLILSIQLLQGYHRWVNDNFSHDSQLRLQWLRLFLILLFMISLQWFVELIGREFYQSYFQYDYSTWLLSGLVLLLAGAGLRQANLTKAHYVAEVTTISKNPAQVDSDLVARILAVIEADKLYLNCELTLNELATHLKVPSKTVSTAINSGTGQSFNDLINGFRVAEVKRRMATTDLNRLTLLALAYESGFNSKSTFNRIFKEQTGFSPSQWLQQRPNPELGRPKTDFGTIEGA